MSPTTLERAVGLLRRVARIWDRETLACARAGAFSRHVLAVDPLVAADVTTLEALSGSRRALDDVDVGRVGAVTALEALNGSRRGLDDVDMGRVGDVTALEALSGSRRGLDDVDMGRVGDVTALEALSGSRRGLDDVDMGRVGDVTALEALSGSRRALDDVDVGRVGIQLGRPLRRVLARSKHAAIAGIVDGSGESAADWKDRQMK